MLKGKKVLIVEDSRTIRLQVKMMLEHEGAVLVEAGSEIGMFTKIDEYGVTADLIIMDLVLNYENGLELIEKLKENPKYKDIPIIIITEKADVNTILKAKQLGVKTYLRKPVDKTELIARMNELIEEQKAGKV